MPDDDREIFRNFTSEQLVNWLYEHRNHPRYVELMDLAGRQLTLNLYQEMEKFNRTTCIFSAVLVFIGLVQIALLIFNIYELQ